MYNEPTIHCQRGNTKETLCGIDVEKDSQFYPTQMVGVFEFLRRADNSESWSWDCYTCKNLLIERLSNW